MITSIPHKIAAKDIISKISALYPLVKVSFKTKKSIHKKIFFITSSDFQSEKINKITLAFT